MTMEKIWLVTHESCVDGEHLYDVTPCICKETAIAVMNTKKEEVLDTYAEARGWMNGEHDEEEMDDCPYEWEESETGFFIQVCCDAYWEKINVEEKDIQY